MRELAVFLSRLLVSWTKIQEAASTRSACILAVVHRPAYFSPPLFSLPVTLFPSLSPSLPPPFVVLFPSISLLSFVSLVPSCWNKWRISIVHHPSHVCTRSLVRLVRLLRGYNSICIVRQSPPGQTSRSVIGIIDSLNRVRGSDGHLLLQPINAADHTSV